MFLQVDPVPGSSGQNNLYLKMLPQDGVAEQLTQKCSHFEFNSTMPGKELTHAFEKGNPRGFTHAAAVCV